MVYNANIHDHNTARAWLYRDSPRADGASFKLAPTSDCKRRLVSRITRDLTPRSRRQGHAYWSANTALPTQSGTARNCWCGPIALEEKRRGLCPALANRYRGGAGAPSRDEPERRRRSACGTHPPISRMACDAETEGAGQRHSDVPAAALTELNPVEIVCQFMRTSSPRVSSRTTTTPSPFAARQGTSSSNSRGDHVHRAPHSAHRL